MNSFIIGEGCLAHKLKRTTAESRNIDRVHQKRTKGDRKGKSDCRKATGFFGFQRVGQQSYFSVKVDYISRKRNIHWILITPNIYKQPKMLSMDKC